MAATWKAPRRTTQNCPFDRMGTRSSFHKLCLLSRWEEETARWLGTFEAAYSLLAQNQRSCCQKQQTHLDFLHP